MSLRKIYLLSSCLLALCFASQSQEKNTGNFMGVKGKYNLELGAGLATYEGDLTQKSTFFGQPGFAFTLGSDYNFSEWVQLNLGFSFMRLRADDKKNSDTLLTARNLNFTSNVWDINATVQINLPSFGKFTPYVDGGIGLFHFNPTTIDRYGNKQMLHKMETEGQGLMDANRPHYLLTEVQLPFGAGVQYSLSKTMALKFDVLFRKTFTDYIDDVSTTYAEASVIDKKFPLIKQLAFRGDEIKPGAPYPSGARRGNPDKKDFYYTGQVKLVYQLKKKLL